MTIPPPPPAPTPELLAALAKKHLSLHPTTPSLHSLAQKQVPWSRVLKDPAAPSNVTQLHDEYLERLYEAHKQSMTDVFNEAFYHKLPIDHFIPIAYLLIPTLGSQSSDEAVRTGEELMKSQYHLPPHARKVLRVAFTMYRLLRRSPGSYGAMTEYVNNKMLQAPFVKSPRRVIDKRFTKNPRAPPLVSHLFVDRMREQSLEGIVKAFGMLPLEFLDDVFADDGADV
ncbi:hypothetical protein HDV00_012761 [Rhizophlyctis rosea]|nr:hypothetical protein HDV00_012761 [Rhizophlyctis rosea]